MTERYTKEQLATFRLAAKRRLAPLVTAGQIMDWWYNEKRVGSKWKGRLLMERRREEIERRKPKSEIEYSTTPASQTTRPRFRNVVDQRR